MKNTRKNGALTAHFSWPPNWPAQRKFSGAAAAIFRHISVRCVAVALLLALVLFLSFAYFFQVPDMTGLLGYLGCTLFDYLPGFDSQ